MRATDLRKPKETLYFGGFKKQPPEAATLKYMKGECAYIALAFNALYGYEMCDFGVHFVAKDPEGFYWDIRGKMTSEQVVDGLNRFEGYQPKLLTFEEIQRMMFYGLTSKGEFKESKLETAKTLIKRLMP